MPGYTPAELAMLSPEEREGLEQEQADQAARAADPAEEEDEAADEAAAAPAAPVAEATAAPAAEVAASPEPAPTAPAEPASAGDAAPPVPVPAAPGAPAAVPAAAPSSVLPEWQAPVGADDKIKEIDTQLDALAKKHDDGEITSSEFTTQQRTLNDQRQELRDAIFKQTLYTDSVKNNWAGTVDGFVGRHPEYAPGNAMRTALATEITRLQAGKSPKEQTNPALLDQAHANIRKQLNLPVEQPGAKPGDIPVKPGQRDPAPNLAGLPASDIEDLTGGGDFAHLERLNGEAYEKALAALTTSQRDQYLAGS